MFPDYPRGTRRGSFGSRGRRDYRRYFGEHYYPGGSREDPLNLNNAPVPDEVQRELSIAIPADENKMRKRSKTNDNSLLLSPTIKKSRSCSNSPMKVKPQSIRGFSPKPTTSFKAPEDIKKSKKDYYSKKYSYGNFDRYYGTRLDPGQSDSRLSIFKKEWFERQTVLDIGCNVGFLTLSLARDFQPRRILGIDIDEHLIGVARKNIRHYCDKDTEFYGKFPASFCNNFGPVSQQSTFFKNKFPDNVWFRKENYVFESEELLETVHEEFDVILALSITKWIHLNWGDDGMRRFFKRIFRHLRPGGKFILEPQPFDSYRKRSKMTESLRNNFASIEFKPDDFEMYLLEEIGFDRVEHLGVPSAKSKGFERHIDVYFKKEPKFLTRNLLITTDDTYIETEDSTE